MALRENLQALQRGEDPPRTVGEAPADVDAPRRWYNELHVGEPNGGVVIADNERIYYDRPGAEGTRFFVPRWDELELFDSDGNTLTTPENIQKALQEFRRGGGMLGVFFHFLGFPHEDPDDASTWGPPSLDAVDWEGVRRREYALNPKPRLTRPGGTRSERPTWAVAGSPATLPKKQKEGVYT